MRGLKRRSPGRAARDFLWGDRIYVRAADPGRGYRFRRMHRNTSAAERARLLMFVREHPDGSITLYRTGRGPNDEPVKLDALATLRAPDADLSGIEIAARGDEAN